MRLISDLHRSLLLFFQLAYECERQCSTGLLSIEPFCLADFLAVARSRSAVAVYVCVCKRKRLCQAYS